MMHLRALLKSAVSGDVPVAWWQRGGGKRWD
jgi:hypothetical protein